MMKKQRKKIVLCDLVEKKVAFLLTCYKNKKQKITRKSLKTPNYHILLWKPSSSYIFLFSRVMRKYWCINKKKVSSIAVFMQSAMYYKLMPFWTTTTKKSFSCYKNNPSSILLSPLSRQLSGFSTSYYPKHKLCSQNKTKKAAFCVKK